MPFSSKVRDEALVLAARYCCVCHRRGGVKVEVHHIIPEAKSKDNTIKNAITLCFDCHCDAGHFNSTHPRGTKLSPSELRKHRAAWHKRVRENNIPPVESKTIFRFRYHLVKNFEQFTEILNGKLPKIWGNSSLYFPGEIGRFHKTIAKLNKEYYRRCDLHLQSYHDHSNYLKSKSEARELSKDERETFPIYESTRPLTDKDLQFVAKNDPITGQVIQSNINPGEFVVPFGHYSPCSGFYLEELIIRPVWPVYLEIVNESDKASSIPKIKAKVSSQSRYAASSINELKFSNTVIEVSSMQLKPGESVFVPIMTVLGPFTGDLEDHYFSSIAEDGQHGYDVQDSVNGQGNLNKCRFLGDSIWPVELVGLVENEEFNQEIHECDFQRFFSLDRDYMCGSCPFLFGVKDHGEKEFIREILVTGENSLVVDEVILTANYTALEVVELQRETTELIEVVQSGEILTGKTILEKGDSISFKLLEGNKKIKFRGGFFLKSFKEIHKESSVKKNLIVKKWLRDT